MKFSAYKYQRPDFPVYQETFKKALANLQSADTFSEAKQALDALNELRGTIDTAMNLASIRYSIDTNDAFYEAEDTFWNEYQPHFEALDFQFYQALLASPVLDELKAEYPETLFLFAESRVKLFDEALIELFQKENQLASDYSKLVASAQIDFQGQTYTLAQLRPFTENKDRSVRKEAFEKQTAFFTENEDRFDQIYDEMVKVRTEIAHKLGFENYVAFADTQMNRWDYDRSMIETYRREI
ncbi:MAG: M3 family oligoendopeptidase, partial [Enterococcus casseliflavus]